MENFTPVGALIGGLLIGTAAALLVFLNGRVAGISGIVGGLFEPKRHDVAWRIAFLAGMLAAPSVFVMFGGGLPAVELDAPTGVLVLAGLLVGFGSRLGSGCTSGHGVCGIARLSSRSLAATGIFMTFAIATVFVVRHVMGG